MKLDKIQGQNMARDHLERAITNGRLAHALIFSGPAGVGKRTTALALARTLLCRKLPGADDQRCPDCHLIDANTHPDLHIEDLERARVERATASQIAVAQVRRLRSSLALQAVRGNRKVAIIEPAEKLTIDAQNALLKTLEEPPGDCTLILVTANADALLSTIRSRCQRILFSPLPDDTVAEILCHCGMDREEAITLAPLAQGSLDEANRLAGEETRERNDRLRALLDELPSLPLPEVLDFAADLAGGKGEDRRRRVALDSIIFLNWGRSRLLAATQLGDPEAIREASQRLRRIHGTTRDLEHYANVQLTWESLLLALRQPARAL